MSAIIVNRNDKRKNLIEQLPLEAPLSVYVQSSNICNFRCKYCAQTLDSEMLLKMKIERKCMEFSLFEKIIEQLKEFNGKIKVLNLTGFGEPLLQKRLPDMIALAKKENVAERVEIVTNASLLTPDLSDKIIAAGLDVLRISIQGMSADVYKEMSDVKIDFDKFVANIRYFYQHKKNTKMYIKIFEEALQEGQKEEDFYNLFGSLCDVIAVEHIVPVMPKVDYNKVKNTNFSTGMQGYKNQESSCCSRAFYMMTINVDGSIRPCCNYEPPMIVGNIEDTESLKELWNGTKMKNFRLMQIQYGRNKNKVCAECNTPVFGIHKEDVLDGYQEELLKMYK
jgi:MoaA/NifB/PqqE/SkfB family radical SAM enzyme